MKKNIIIGILGFIVFVVIICIAFAAGAGETKVTPTPTPIPTVIPTPVVDVGELYFYDQYMQGCEDGTNQAYCDCTFKKLRAKHTLAEMGQMGIDGKITDEIMKIALECSTASKSI